MRNKLTIALSLILILIVVACTPEEVIETPTPVATQTPFIQIVTATLSPTPLATLTPVPSVTAIRPTPDILGRCSLRTDWEIYIVKVGDTLSNISVRTNTTVTTLQLANCIPDVNRIRVGQELYVPELPSDTEVTVEDIINEFTVNVAKASPGATIIFNWDAESGTVIEIKFVTLDDRIIASNLNATGALTYTLPEDLGDATELEFVITGVKTEDDKEILASPHSVFIELMDEVEVTEEPETTEEPSATEEPETTEEPEVTEEA